MSILKTIFLILKINFLVMRGRRLVDKEKFDDAIPIFNQVLELDPSDNFGARYNLGVAYFKKVLKDELSRSNSLSLQEKKDLLNKAENCWREVLKNDPKDRMVSSSLAKLRSYRRDLA
jgi:tetratricopeptide (TPR) repeat protein